MVLQKEITEKIQKVMQDLIIYAQLVVLISHTVYNDIAWLDAVKIRLKLSICNVVKAY